MATINMLRTLISLCVLSLVLWSSDARGTNDKYFMDKMCGNDFLVLDGDKTPGISLKLTNSNKYKNDFSCIAKFRAAQPTQRLVVTVEKMDITDCPGDSLLIYDGTTLLNKDANQQCGSTGSFTFTSSTSQVSLKFTSNSAIESSGFQISMALDFPTIALCPQNLGVFRCKNKNCISKQLQCDGRDHCGDGTDENECSIISG